MRIIAGSKKGHSLTVSKVGVRPTSERVRESIFNRLDASGIEWTETRVLDLFAGSAAFALESLSRGAKLAYAVEKDRDALKAIGINTTKTGLPLNTLKTDATKPLRLENPTRFTLIFIDPPYEFANQQITNLLTSLQVQNLLDSHGVCIVERSSHTEDFAIPMGFNLEDVRNHGDTRLFWLVW